MIAADGGDGGYGYGYGGGSGGYGWGDGYGDYDAEPGETDMTKPRPPRREDLAAAFREGAPVYFGCPAWAHSPDGFSILNLAAAQRGEPDPYHTTRVSWDGQVVDLATVNDRGLYVQGLPVHDRAPVMAALDAAPAAEARHTEAGHAARLRAGRLAMEIRDAHVRAAVMSLVDGWGAVTEDGELLDADEQHGRLYRSDMADAALVLCLTCPSTQREYVHLVPGEFRTARDARRWMMCLGPGDPDPDAES